MSILNLSSKREPKQRSVKEIFSDVDALVMELAKSDAWLEAIIETDTGLQYELRHALMLAVVGKRLKLNCPANYAHPGGANYDPRKGVETRNR